ncbi:GspE/PulE family protein [Mucisphaera calidilacus]|uniref:Type II secretion system protein E n=1 Tax=Mucisphaera calidilacus TaxID=2527982 RepID=A0A518BTH3_9BACT|nr:ATPase, T2SS/T4P/T4SS family [Mucisphaera calidilacus]QDU70267.1 Type II secretion system protein E [Mucisphaera calidilacus]
MTPATLAQAETVFLLSWFKPIVVLAVLIGWARMVSTFDKDLEYFHLPRMLWNGGHMLAAVAGFGAIFLIPIFFVGLPIGLLLMFGSLYAYANFRNHRVPFDARWDLSFNGLKEQITAWQKDQAEKHASLRIEGSDGEHLQVPVGNDPQVESHAVLAEVLNFAIPRNADRIEMTIDKELGKVTARVDGVLYPQPDIESKKAMGVLEYVKGAAGMDLSSHRKREQGRLGVDLGEFGTHRLALETAGSTRGVRMIMDVNPAKQTNIPLNQIGLTETQHDQILKLVSEPGGTVLISAPPQQGLTTTLYSILQAHDPYTSSVITVERQKPFEVEGVNHQEFGDEASPDKINERLKVLLRSDPNVLMISEVFDDSTPKLMAPLAEECRFYVPMKADSGFEAAKRWMRMVGDPKLATANITAVLHQRLVRRLCSTCRTAYKPDPAALKKLNIPADKVDKLYQASGQVEVKGKARTCPACMGIGYRGRIGVFELMIYDDTARSLLRQGDFDNLRTHLRKQKLQYLQEAALAKVVSGETDIKEITRVLGGSKTAS